MNNFFIPALPEQLLRKHFAVLRNHNSTKEQIAHARSEITYRDKGFYNYIRAFARSYAKRDFHLLEDLLQEVWMKICQEAHKYKEISSAHEWRRRVAERHIKSFFRRENRRKRIVRIIPFIKGTGIEDLLGDDPNLPPEPED